MERIKVKIIIKILCTVDLFWCCFVKYLLIFKNIRSLYGLCIECCKIEFPML